MGALAVIFGYLLKLCLLLVKNYGWAVVLFSVIIKAILFPLTLKQQKSLKKNQELQPKLAELQEKYKNNQEQLAIEYQKFMKDNKFNPFGGCLLMILQLVILFGVLYVVSSPMTYMERYSQEEVNLALKEALINQDFSGESGEFSKFAVSFIDQYSGEKIVKESIKEADSKEEAYILAYKKTNRYHELKILKEKADLNFLGINLGDITSQKPSDIRLWIFPVLTVISYYISLWMVSKKQKKTTQKMKDADGNEIEMPNMMTMNIMMPLMSGWIAYSVPQSMALYWFINSILQIAIQLITDKVVDKGEKSSTINEKGEVVLKPIEPIREESDAPIKETKKNPNSSKKKKKKK